MNATIEISVTEVKKAVAEWIKKTYNVGLDPSCLIDQFVGRYDEREFNGFTAEIPLEKIQNKAPVKDKP